MSCRYFLIFWPLYGSISVKCQSLRDGYPGEFLYLCGVIKWKYYFSPYMMLRPPINSSKQSNIIPLHNWLLVPDYVVKILFQIICILYPTVLNVFLYSYTFYTLALVYIYCFFSKRSNHFTTLWRVNSAIEITERDHDQQIATQNIDHEDTGKDHY